MLAVFLLLAVLGAAIVGFVAGIAFIWWRLQ